jgi:predicted nucleotidyltransferase
LPRARRILEEDSRVIFAYLFGSYGRDKPTPLSDIDIAIFLDPRAKVGTAKLDLIDKLTRALETEEADLVILNEAPLSLAGRIQQSSQILVDKDRNCRMTYESLTRRQFADFAFHERAILARRFGIDR